MAVEIWQDEAIPNAFRVAVTNQWNWQQVEATSTVIEGYRTQHPDVPVHLIIEVEGPLPIPTDIEERTQSYLYYHERRLGGLIVIVTNWGVVRTVTAMLRATRLIRFAPSVEQARDIIRSAQV